MSSNISRETKEIMDAEAGLKKILEAPDKWIVRTIEIGSAKCVTESYFDEASARVSYADAVEDVRSGDLTAAVLYRRATERGIRQETAVAGAWDEEASKEEIAPLSWSISKLNDNDAAGPRETWYYYITRADGKRAWLSSRAWGTFRDCDIWNCIRVLYPRAYDLIDESMIEVERCQQSYDEKFGDGLSKLGLEDWIRAGEITADTYSGELEDGARIEADRIDGIATVTWTVDGIEVSQEIALNEGDFARIASGADPVAEGWEDGSGWRPVCLGNASGDVPAGLREEAIETADWGIERAGDRQDEIIQDGIWRDMFQVRAVYRVDPDARTLVSLRITGVEE